MVFSKIPNNGWNIIGTLMIGNNNQRPLIGHFKGIGKLKTRTQNTQTPHQKKIEPINGFFMSSITHQLMAKDLDQMEKDQSRNERQII